MRRRLAGLLVLAATLTAFVLPASAAVAVTDVPAIVLAAGAVEGEEAPGPEPMGPNETENPAAPEDYEANFLWGAGVGLLAIMLLGALALGALYFLLVVRPQRENA